MRPVFGTERPVVIYPASGTGAWEAALVNTLSPGDSVLMAETGQFAALWQKMAQRLGLEVEVDAGRLAPRRRPRGGRRRGSPADRAHAIKAVAVVHNETSTGVTSRVAEVRAAIDGAGAPGAVAGRHHLVAGLDRYRHDAWGVDVTVAARRRG